MWIPNAQLSVGIVACIRVFSQADKTFGWGARQAQQRSEWGEWCEQIVIDVSRSDDKGDSDQFFYSRKAASCHSILWLGDAGANNPLIGRCRSEQSSGWVMPERTILWLGDAGANRLVGLVRIRRNWKTCAVICQTYLRGESSKNESDFSHSLHFQRNLASTEWRKLGRKPDARWKPLGRAGENEVPAPGSSEGAWKVENRRRFLWKASLKHLRNKFKQHWKLTVLD